MQWSADKLILSEPRETSYGASKGQGTACATENGRVLALAGRYTGFCMCWTRRELGRSKALKLPQTQAAPAKQQQNSEPHQIRIGTIWPTVARLLIFQSNPRPPPPSTTLTFVTTTATARFQGLFDLSHGSRDEGDGLSRRSIIVCSILPLISLNIIWSSRRLPLASLSSRIEIPIPPQLADDCESRPLDHPFSLHQRKYEDREGAAG